MSADPAEMVHSEEPPLPSRALLANSIFSEMRHPPGSVDSVNGKATRIVSLTAAHISDRTGRATVTYRPSALRARGVRSLLITYESGATQAENVPTSGSDERTLDLTAPNPVAVTMWNDVFTGAEHSHNGGRPILVSFVTPFPTYSDHPPGGTVGLPEAS